MRSGSWLLVGGLLIASACSRTGLEVVDAGRDAGFDAGRDAGFDAGRPPPVDAECDRALTLTPRRVDADRSAVVFLVDASSSMNEPLEGATSRWDALIRVLVGPDGLTRRLESELPIGAVRYQGVVPCPELDHRPARFGAAAAVAELLASPPAGSTPTGDAIAWARMNIATLVDRTRPTAFVLVTDGEPNPCSGPGDPEDVVREVESAHRDGIETYVLGISAGAGGISDANLQALANAGVGATEARPTEWWRALDVDGLAVAIANATDAARGCDAALPVPFEDRCGGEVTLDGRALTCGGADGYEIRGERLLIHGAACTAWHDGAPLVIRVEC